MDVGAAEWDHRLMYTLDIILGAFLAYSGSQKPKERHG